MLQTDFNNEVIKLGTTKSLCEIDLFTALRNALVSRAEVDIIHGARSKVFFDIPKTSPVVSKSCELGDLMIVSFDKNSIRYTIMQNKTRHKLKTYFGLMPLRVSLRQFYILSQRPMLKVNNKISYITNDILKSALLDSVGSYGVFYKIGSKYDMNYMIASEMVTTSTATINHFIDNKEVSVAFNGTKDLIKKNPINGYDEVSGCEKLDDFEKQLKKMKIGTPILLGKTILNHNMINYLHTILQKSQIRSNKNVLSKLNNLIKELNSDEIKIDNGRNNLPGMDILVIDNSDN